MEERTELQGLHRFMQFSIYLFVSLDIAYFIILPVLTFSGERSELAILNLHRGLSRLLIYQKPLYSRLFIMLLVLLTSLGTLSKKSRELSAKKHIVIPLSVSLILLFSGLLFYSLQPFVWLSIIIKPWVFYVLLLLAGTILFHLGLDNISKIVSSKLGKDIWNREGESFKQEENKSRIPLSVSIPMLYYYKKKVRKGFINIENIFRGTLLIGTPGSGKSFGVVMPFIRELIDNRFCICLYDFKFPDLASLAYLRYLNNRAKGVNMDFHVINLNQVEMSRRINVFNSGYIKTLADAAETAEALVEALKKGDKSGGSDQFFTQSAVNFLAACIYFFARLEGGKYSTLPHVLSFLNCTYQQIFDCLTSNEELSSLLSPFMSAYRAKAFDQLEGQVGTLKIFISRMATLETFWVFSGDDFSLKISDPEHPSILVLANDPATQNINSTCYSVVLNRLTRLINSKGNLPSALILDELPTIFVHRIENLIATARSNKVAVLMGLQELPQFHQHYGKEVANTICSVVGNVLSGSVRSKETLDWLEKLFGRVKQESESLSIDRSKLSISLSERLENLIPSGKIAALSTGEMVGILAREPNENYAEAYEPSVINCKINLDLKAVAAEEASYLQLPVFYDFKGNKMKVLSENFKKINNEIKLITGRFLKS
ncbi:type IV secretion system DNA-binding domain-containing protein [Pedobacter sp. MC2016-05]|uniref:TraM recognition domain-containing protein n=1 Tax=Pedobacter sp. MC2016-05 TaxID=2994474 RepID=UPI00224641BB|nr:TraM recognition domain-containing protein [Pedobacter sp. MC2016-05]MCX2476327.1 type IV secretion system DNA-binding domain-containing protein [Pedobacter sp. MC2016-05]